MWRALPQVAELLLPSPSEERWAETEGVWLEPGRLYKQHIDLFTKIDSEPDQAGIEFGENIEPHVGGRWVSLVDGLLFGWLVG